MVAFKPGSQVVMFQKQNELNLFQILVSIQQLCDEVKIVPIDYTAELELPGK